MFRSIFVILLASYLMMAPPSVYAKEQKGRYYFEKRGEVIWEVPTTQKVICLTFDDGPDPTFTPQVLNLLKQNQAKATFFLTGNQVEHFPEIVRQEIADGHEVANHTFHHKYLSRLTEEQIESEILKAQDSIFTVTGRTTKLFRPPGGYYNERIVNTAKKNGYTVVMWSWHQETKDWSDPGVRSIVSKVLKNTRNGDIILLHDHSGDRSQTVRAVAKIIPELKKRGYQFITVSELLEIKQSEAGTGRGDTLKRN